MQTDKIEYVTVAKLLNTLKFEIFKSQKYAIKFWWLWKHVQKFTKCEHYLKYSNPNCIVIYNASTFKTMIIWKLCVWMWCLKLEHAIICNGTTFFKVTWMGTKIYDKLYILF